MYGYQAPQQQYSQAPAYGHGRGSRHAQQHQYGPPQGADPQLWQLFSGADTDHSGAISASELQNALVNRNYRIHCSRYSYELLIALFLLQAIGRVNRFSI